MNFIDYALPSSASDSLEFESTEQLAYTITEAIEAGFDPAVYEWRTVPEGTWDARLDFKTWSNRAASGPLLCYFSELQSGKRFRLSAARPWVSEALRYTPKDRAVDFSRPHMDGRIFTLRVRQNAKGHVVWVGAIAKHS